MKPVFTFLSIIMCVIPISVFADECVEGGCKNGKGTMVFSTGLAPALLGFLIDAGVGIEAIALGCALYCVGASALATRA